MSSFESWIDRQIREAVERGDFDDLAGAGGPLPGKGEEYDENWWLKQWVQREEVTGVVRTTLRITREAEEIEQTVGRLPSEQAVRRVVADLNTRIEEANLGHVDGPAVYLATIDIEKMLTV